MHKILFILFTYNIIFSAPVSTDIAERVAENIIIERFVSVNSADFTEVVINLDVTANASAGTWDPALIDEIAFTSLAANRTFDIDHIDLATKEFQFFQYQSFKENINNFQYWSSELRGLYRTHGEAVDELV